MLHKYLVKMEMNSANKITPSEKISSHCGPSVSGRSSKAQRGGAIFVCLFITEEIPITVSWWAPDKEARPSYYHYCS